MRFSDLFISTQYQDLFDAAVRGMAKQGQHCAMYTDRKHRRHCAVGFCLTEEGADLLLRNGDNATRINLLGMSPTYEGRVDDPLKDFVAELQTVNDCSHSRENFRKSLRHVAGIYRLSTDLLDELLTDEWTQDFWFAPSKHSTAKHR